MTFITITFFALALLAASAGLAAQFPAAFLIAGLCAVAGGVSFTQRNRFRVAPPLREEDGELLATPQEKLEEVPGINATEDIQHHHGRE